MGRVLVDKKEVWTDNKDNELYWSKVLGEGLQMNTVRLRNVEIGAGKPKVIVPIVGRTVEDILAKGYQIQTAAPDVAEWRVDHFEAADDVEAVLDTLARLRDALGEIPILVTFRTRKEGGEREISREAYTALNQAVARSGLVDAVDVEVFFGEDVARENIDNIHAAGVAVVGSSHEFGFTPKKEELIARLCRQQELGCDILKIAVMPNSPQDVLTLLSATEEMCRVHARQPLVTVSMGALGALSRLCGEVFGSAMTFGTVGDSSAPGQVPVERLNAMLEMLHQSILMK